MPLKTEQIKKIDLEIKRLRELIQEEHPEERNSVLEKMSYSLQYGVLAIIELLEGRKNEL